MYPSIRRDTAITPSLRRAQIASPRRKSDFACAPD
jgi:hypothetical protein